jgi:predicted Ser/Thr protein kinase
VTVVAGRYQLLTRIGEGGMGVVWRAHDQLLDRQIAVKELHIRVGVDGDYHTKQVLREARAAARLRHPGVIAVHDVIVDNGRPLILMELVDGLSLADMIRRQGPVSEEKVAEIGARVLDALAVAHAQGVVHRDVKPANILLAGNRVVLTDFGIAAAAGDTTGTEGLVGSFDYMAPERVNGHRATPASDIWSLGVTLCAALRGESPFRRSDTQATLAAVLNHEPAPIPQAPRLWRVVKLLLDKDPRQRLTASGAAAMLAAIAGVPRPAAEPPAAEPPVEPATMRVPDPPDAGPVVEPLRYSSTGSRTRAARRRGQRLGVLLAVLSVLVAGGLWLVVRPADGVAGTATAGAKPTSTLPEGFKLEHGEGYTIQVPKGWFKDNEQPQDIYWVANPNGPTVYTSLMWWGDSSAGGAYKVLTDLERSGYITINNITKYKRIKLVRIPAPAGTTRAEIEMTYHVTDLDFYVHELVRAYVTDKGQIFVIGKGAQNSTRATTEQLWRERQDDLDTILQGFRITS